MVGGRGGGIILGGGHRSVGGVLGRRGPVGGGGAMWGHRQGRVGGMWREGGGGGVMRGSRGMGGSMVHYRPGMEMGGGMLRPGGSWGVPQLGGIWLGGDSDW